jgi:seryl-tRNA synthetase
MLDIKMIKDDVEGVIKRLNTRGQDYSYLRDVVTLDDERLALIKEVENKKQFRNEKSKKIGVMKRKGEDIATILNEVENTGAEIKQLDEKINDLDEKIGELIENTPNVPRETVTVGLSEDDNKLLRTVLEPKVFAFKPKPHYELAENLDIVDFERAGKVTGSRFVYYKGLGARLERALINFMLDIHTLEHGFTEMIPPLIVNSQTMYGMGQLPKFAEDMFKIQDSDYWLIPTSEVPLTAYRSNEIIMEPNFPIKFTAYTACFRSEAGSAGRDTRGLIRQHQFNKVEMVIYSHPEKSYEMLELMTGYAEEILKRLEIPYRVVELCTGDMGFGSATTNDIEVWLPGFNAYREISSCSNITDFQARRANIKFKENKEAKAEYIHTLNGSGLAVGRTFAALIENYQQEDGSIVIPKVLVPYMGGIEKIEKL